MKSKLNGLVAAPFTPMREDGSVNLPVIAQQAQLLETNGVSGAFICGTTGEGFSLTTEERMQVAEAWLAALPKSLKVIVHVGHNSMEDSRKLASHAARIGAHAFATIGPNFFKPSDVAQLVGYCQQVAEAAPNLPFYFYHMPAMTGINFAMIDFLKAASGHIPNLAGIKFTHENLMDYTQCLHFENGKFDILFGRDEILLGALALGATGAVGSTYNYMAPIYQQVLAVFKRGDMETARRHQMKAIDIIAVMSRHGGLPAGKAMMKMVGVDCGPSRAPLCTLTPADIGALTKALEPLGFPTLSEYAAAK
jgi:N-acetylneuraminate lyase